jgi:hypothetical protein
MSKKVSHVDVVGTKGRKDTEGVPGEHGCVGGQQRR